MVGGEDSEEMLHLLVSAYCRSLSEALCALGERRCLDLGEWELLLYARVPLYMCGELDGVCREVK